MWHKVIIDGMNTPISPGQRVTVQDAGGDWLPRLAVSGIEPGHTFPVVWVSREAEWQAAHTEGRDPEATPWPADDVRVEATETADA